jgi:hypothetical protein
VADVASVATIVGVSVALEWDRLTGPTWLGMDTATAFFPWYTFLGEQLRAGHVPVWNPHQFSGAPFAADPESGWMYLPAMLAFTLLPLDAAIRAHLLFHILLAGLSTYALGRVLGLNAIGALLGATIYAHSGFFEGHNVCCYAYADVAAWLPLLLLGAERATRASRWGPRAVWWGVSGLAFSQILAAWIGQGAYYAVLVLGSFVAYRTLPSPRRLSALPLHLTGILGFGSLLGAAGLLPRLEYNLVSNLPGGYPDAEVSLRATTLTDWGLREGWDRLLLQPGFEYIGLPVLILTLLAALVGLARRQGWVVYFAALGLAVLILARAEPTPLHAALSLLPGFERIHARSPERALIVFYLAPALLSGATLSWLSDRPRRIVRSVVALGVIAGVTVDLHSAWLTQAGQSLAGGGDYQFERVDITPYYEPGPAARYLTAQMGEQPFRYFGYAGHVFGGPMPYTLRWQDPAIAALEVNNRALVTGLDDIQGYNPVHLARYDAFMAALNGHPQNYHHTDVFDSGFDSSLLDALGVRYVVMPTALASDEVAPQFTRPLQPVFEDGSVTIFENSMALPRAWIVHVARQVAPESAAQALADDGFDPRSMAILEDSPPPLSEPTLSAQQTDAVEVVIDDVDHVTLRATTMAPALVVLSDAYYPAWHAYLDGASVPLYATDVALRGIALPAGAHVIELRYESAALTIGLVLSVAAFALLAVLAGVGLAILVRDGSGEVRCESGAVPQL